MIHAADEADRAEEEPKTPKMLGVQAGATARATFADEFVKLVKLKADGILSESEFNDLKVALIAQTKAQ